MFGTLGDIAQKVLTELGLVDGTSVQVYTEPQIVTNVNTVFVTLAQKRFWPHLTKTTSHVLDGSVGYVTDASIGINELMDIQWVRFDPYYPSCIIHDLKGEEYPDDGGYYYDGLDWQHADVATKLIKFYPPELNLNIKIRARRMPQPFVDNSDIVPFDKVAMTHLVTSNLLATDGLNPNAERRHTILFDQRYQDLISNEAQQVHYYGRNRNSSFTVAE